LYDEAFYKFYFRCQAAQGAISSLQNSVYLTETYRIKEEGFEAERLPKGHWTVCRRQKSEKWYA